MTFETAAQMINAWVEDGSVPGASIIVSHRGSIVAEHTVGMAAPDRPMTPDTLFALASVSKPITVAACMLAVDEGLLDLDTPVIDVLPSFGHNIDSLDPDMHAHLEMLRDDVTFRQLLCHTSGLPEQIGVKRLRVSSLPTQDEQIDAMLRVPLASAPGERLRYSNLGIGIASRITAHLFRRNFHDVVQSGILDPLGLRDIQLTPSPAYDDRIALVQDPANEGQPAESYNSRYWRDMGITWGGYFGTPKALLAFALGFTRREHPVLSPDAVEAMTRDQTGGVDGGVESLYAIWHPGAWGCGWEVKGSKPRHWTGTLSSAETFCHWGQAGTLTWVDPIRQLGVSVFANRTVRTMWPFKQQRWLTLSDAITTAADEVSR